MKHARKFWVWFDSLPFNKRFGMAVLLASPVIGGNALLRLTGNPLWVFPSLIIIPIVLTRLKYMNEEE